MTLSQKNTLDLLYLIGCALNETEPDPARVQKMHLEAIYSLAISNSLGAIVYAGLGEQISQCPDDLASHWAEYANMTLRNAMLLDFGRETILAKLEEAGIWYLPLKGSILQNYYPDLGLREMCDNDILFDVSRRQDVISIMEGLGYDAELGNLDTHDVYTKKPVYNYEMHLAIMGEQHEAEFRDYYKNFEKKLLPGEDGAFSRRMRDEDFYIHLIVHAYKHFTTSGTGLRIFPDLYVYLNEKKDSMDWNYIRTDLGKLNVQDFEVNLLRITQRVFEAPQSLTEQDWVVLDYCANCGTYGTQAIKAQNAMRALQNSEGPISLATSIRYFWRRIWPDKQTCQLFHPFAAKYPLLKPFWAIYRIFRALFFRRELLKSEFHALSSVNDEQPVS